MRKSHVATSLPIVLALLVLSSSSSAATNVSGAINLDTTWNLAGSPYVMTGDVTVASGVTLTIQPGVEVQGSNAESGDVELIVTGTLNATGSPASPIVFRSQSSTSPGAWEGIRTVSGASMTLADVVIQHADYPIELAAPSTSTITIDGVTIETFQSRGINVTSGGSLNLDNVVVSGAGTGSQYGVYTTQTALGLRDSRITGCATGLYSGSGNVIVEHTVFANSTNEGIRYQQNVSGTYNLNISYSTFWGNTEAVDIGRSTSSSYQATLTITSSLFGQNGTLVRDSSSPSGYPITFSSFLNNVWWGGAQWASTSPSTNSGNLQYNGLLVDPAAGNFEPTDRSPARYFAPADPARTVGAIPFAGAPTGSGLHGFWYVNRTIDPTTDGTVTVTGDVVIAAGAKLTILPGATLQMDSADVMVGGLNSSKIEIRVEGQLEADGTSSRHVIFTSAAAVPARGDWYGFVIPSLAEAFNILQVEVRYAYRGVSLYANDHVVGGSYIRDCSDAGIWIDGGTPSIEGMEIRDNRIGISVGTSATVDILDTDVWNSTQYGVYAAGSSITWNTGIVHDNGDDGIRIQQNISGSRSVSLTHLTIAHNSGDGVEFSRSTSSSYSLSVTLSSSSVTHNESNGVRDSGSPSGYPSTFSCGASNVWGNGGSDFGGLAQGTCFTYNPLYADAVGRDYHPTTHSPNRRLGSGASFAGALDYNGVMGPNLEGYLWENYTFRAASSPYSILGDVVVPTGVTVTFEPGVVLRVAASTDDMRGGLTSSATEIRFLPGSTASFPSSGGSVRFTPESGSPTAGMWYGLRMEDASTSVIDNALIEYAQYGVYVIGPRAPRIEDTTILYPSSYGVRTEGVNTAPLVDVLATSVIGTGSGYGISLTSSSGDVRSSYVTHLNRGLHAYNSVSGTTTVYFVNNTVVHSSTGIEYGRATSSSYGMTAYVSNNVVANSTSYALVDSNNASGYSSNDTVTYNAWYNVSTTSATFNSASNNITSNPLIEDDDWDAFPRWWDGKLWWESTSIEAGNASVAHFPTRDIVGAPRTIGTRPDMGAWERDPATNQEPRADAVATSIMVPRGEPFALDGSAAFDPDGTIASAWWTMSDGTVTAGRTIQHTFATDGAAWAYITVVDDDGAEDHARVDINVNVRPVADAGIEAYADAGTEEAVFDGSLSYDPDNNVGLYHGIVLYAWDFGDGSSVASGATLDHPRHTYAAGGTYLVTLTVTDNEGLTHTDTTLAHIYSAVDTAGPLIQHTEVADGRPLGQAVAITANIQDSSGIANAVLYYRAIGAGAASFAVMTNSGGNLWNATIPGPAVTAAGVEYWIIAVDASAGSNASTAPDGAPASDVFDFTVNGDPNPPAIAHTEIADNQPPGSPVTVSATITDATGVGAATVYYRPIGGSTFGVVPMSVVAGNVWSAAIPGVVVVAPGVQYYIEAIDTSPIPNTGRAPAGAPTTLYDFTVGSGDTTLPVIAHTPIPDGQPAGVAVPVSAGIADAGGVSRASIFYRTSGSGGAFTEVTMTNTSGATWSGQIPGGAVTTAGVEYYVSATDAASNTATDPAGAPASFHDFTVVINDTAPPSITHTPIANGQPEGINVVVNATVTDASGLSTVRLHYRPEGFPFYQETTMSSSGGDAYTGTIPGFSVAAPGVEYYIRAVDTRSNTGYAPLTAPATPYRFSVGSSDVDPPVLAHVPISDGQEAGLAVPVSVTVIDDTGVASVVLSYRAIGGGTYTNLPMTNSGGSTWSVSIPGPSVVVPGVEYYITAVDSSPNSNEATEPAGAPGFTHTFSVEAPDTVAPVITHSAISSLDFGDSLAVTATITDDVGVAGATLHWALDSGAFSQLPMSAGAGNTWSATVPAGSIPGGTVLLRYWIEAVDGAPNSASHPAGGASAPHVVTLLYPDTTGPVLSVEPIASPQLEGTPIVVGGTATDADSGIASVTVEYRATGAPSWTQLTASGTDSWTATIPGVAVVPPGIDVRATAEDGAGNSTTSAVQAVVVSAPADVDPPSIALTPVADGQLEGIAVDVSAAITDPSDVSVAELNHRVQGAAIWSTVTMTSSGGGLWIAEIPGTSVSAPAVEYWVRAVDGAPGANEATAPAGAPAAFESFAVTLVDGAGPTIAHVPSATVVAPGQPIPVTATITDGSGVASASVYHRVEGAPGFTELAMSAAGDVWSATIPGGSVLAPGVEYYIGAVDLAPDANASTAPAGAPSNVFEVAAIAPDTIPPAITHTPIADGQTSGVAVIVDATVTDASGIGGAVLHFREIGDTDWLSVAMTDMGAGAYRGTIPRTSVLVPGVEYYLHATDSSALANEATDPAGAPGTFHGFSVIVPDVEGPQLEIVPIGSPQTEGTAVPVVASASDPSGVEDVTLHYLPAGETDWISLPLAPGAGDSWSGAIPAGDVAPGIMEYWAEASDGAGNTAADPIDGELSPYSFSVRPATAEDTTAPSIAHLPVETAPQNAAIEIEAVVTDASEVAWVTLFYRRGDAASWSFVELEWSTGDVWFGEIPAAFTRGTTAEYYFEATDASPRSNVGTEPPGAPTDFFVIELEVPGGDAGDAGGDSADAGEVGDTGIDAADATPVDAADTAPLDAADMTPQDAGDATPVDAADMTPPDATPVDAADTTPIDATVDSAADSASGDAGADPSADVTSDGGGGDTVLGEDSTTDGTSADAGDDTRETRSSGSASGCACSSSRRSHAGPVWLAGLAGLIALVHARRRAGDASGAAGRGARGGSR